MIAAVVVTAYLVVVGLVAWHALIRPAHRRRDPFDLVYRRDHALEVMATWAPSHEAYQTLEARRVAELLEADRHWQQTHGEVEE